MSDNLNRFRLAGVPRKLRDRARESRELSHPAASAAADIMDRLADLIECTEPSEGPAGRMLRQLVAATPVDNSGYLDRERVTTVAMVTLRDPACPALIVSIEVYLDCSQKRGTERAGGSADVSFSLFGRHTGLTADERVQEPTALSQFLHGRCRNFKKK